MKGRRLLEDSGRGGGRWWEGGLLGDGGRGDGGRWWEEGWWEMVGGRVVGRWWKGGWWGGGRKGCWEMVGGGVVGDDGVLLEVRLDGLVGEWKFCWSG